jgi:hypothetical protein
MDKDKEPMNGNVTTPVGKRSSAKEVREQEAMLKTSAVENVSDTNKNSDESKTVEASQLSVADADEASDTTVTMEEVVENDVTNADKANTTSTSAVGIVSLDNTDDDDENKDKNPTAGKKASSLEPYIGMRFRKKFSLRVGRKVLEEYYAGTIVSGPQTFKNTITGVDDLEWHVKYVDEDEEDLSLDELRACKIMDDGKHVNDEENTDTTRRSGRSRKRPDHFRSFEPSIGMKFQKKFDETGEYYIGTVISGPEPVINKNTGLEELEWHVRYEDEDEEDLSLEELLSCRLVDTKRQKIQAPRATKVSTYDSTREALRALPTMTDEEVVAALETVGPPYGMQAVTEAVHKARDAQNYAEPSSGLFNPEIGIKLRKLFDGKNWYGTVTGDEEVVDEPSEVEGQPPRKVKVWQVTYDDGDIDDMTWQELFKYRADRPSRGAPCRGRVLQCLELFSGECRNLNWYLSAPFRPRFQLTASLANK